MADDPTVKAGARNSSVDSARITQIMALAKQIMQIGCDLGASDADTEDDMEMEGDGKSLSLDKLTTSVTQAVDALNRGFFDKPYDEWIRVEGVYTDVVILREGLTYWQVAYTIGETKVQLAQRSEWVEVEPKWATVQEAPAPFEQETPDEAIGEANKAGDADEARSMRSVPVYRTMKLMAPGRLRHYAVLWGDAEKRDVYNEWFTPKTEELEEIFKAMGKLPLLYHHGMDAQVKTEVIGTVEEMGRDDIGLWVESQLNLANRYAQAMASRNGIIEQGKMGTSSGTLPGARRVKKSGEIERWPVVEVTLTVTPAETRLVRDQPVSILKSAYEELGLPAFDQVLFHDTGAEKARRTQELALERERLALLSIS